MQSEYPKLVRDNIPEIILANSGRSAATEALKDDAAFLKFLLQKIVEEANEVAASKDSKELIEELADVYEVIDAILNLKNITREEILTAQSAKRTKRGGFAKRLLMLHNDEKKAEE